MHSIPQVFTGSFAVDLRDHLRSRIICGPFWGSFAVSGSFAAGDHLRYCTVLQKSQMYNADQILYISRILPQIKLLPIQ